MKRIAIGILAHVDAGKTTLSEAMLYHRGLLKKLGRVDHQDAFLDTDTIEKERGITIFSKQALLPLEEDLFTLLDTPGHVDFSGEMERTLQVLDYAILVISGMDGVQSHTKTLWELLRRCHIPTFIFINKMDLAGADREQVLASLQKQLSPACLDALAEDFAEQAAMEDEDALTEYLDSSALCDDTLARMIQKEQVFPCYFGSALKLMGVTEFLDGLSRLTREPARREDFGATVYKIARDKDGTRLTYMKITGGKLKVKDLLSGESRSGEPWQEKADQIRIYSGARFQPAQEAAAGTVCAVTGLNHTYAGQGLGSQPGSEPPVLEPVMSCQVLLPKGVQPAVALQQLSQLEEEDPQLHIVWNEALREIQLQMMGEVQLDVLHRMILERFGMEVSFGPGNIVYRETITKTVEGIGHFEPLRHYAEVHLLMEPLPAGSGLHFGVRCSEDQLDKNWQRLIFTHLWEKRHAGVLTRSPITDMKITLVAGRAHPKHTEGGDFRQATYRAVRQGLMQGESILLEPWYTFRLEAPADCIGRAMADLQRMGGEFEPPVHEGDTAILTGAAPVSTMQGYPLEVTSYTHGHGKLFCGAAGFRPCHNTEEVIRQCGYQPEHDMDNPADSVFCMHGAGFTVKWQEVASYAHVDSGLNLGPARRPSVPSAPRSSKRSPLLEEDAELAAIFERTYGPVKRRELFRTPPSASEENTSSRTENPGPEYVLVDGYNVIFSWPELKELARVNLEAARNALADLLCNYQGFRSCCAVILVYDAYKVPHGSGDVEKYKNIHIVYTREAETADMYIEKLTLDLAKKRRVRVVTSDNAEQMIIAGHGALRVSVSLFYEEIKAVHDDIRHILEENKLRQGFV